MFGPAATAMYCLPSNEYVIGEAFHVWLVSKLHSGLPVNASTAISSPPSAPKITRPVAVASVPPQDCAGPGCGSSHLIAPLRMSSAFKTRSDFGSGAVRRHPPTYV